MKIGLIGLGAIGSMHFNNVRNGKVPNCEIAAVCDEKGVDEKKFPSCKAYVKVEDILADRSVETLIVATPSFNHYTLAKQCLESGKNVLVEKPAALTSLEAADISAIARRCAKV